MKIQLVDTNKIMCNFWRLRFAECENVEVYCGDFFSLPTDCVVSPANSFGFMDGGLDAVITKKLGIKTQEKLQKIIQDNFDGELLVGQAVLIETELPEIPYCISAPTMRVPMRLKTNEVDVYLAAKAAFLVAKKNPQIKTLTISGLGTGVGQVHWDTCAKQMKSAYDDIFLDKLKFPSTLAEASNKHREIISSL